LLAGWGERVSEEGARSRGDVRTRWALSLVRTPEGREAAKWTVQNKETAHQRVSRNQVHQDVALASWIVL